MFTGLVESIGTVTSIERTATSARLRIHAPEVLEDARTGDSVAVDGCCLTLVEHHGTEWTSDLMLTTLEATALGDLQPGDRVNLERAVRADSRLGGHIVQGHVDGVAVVRRREHTAHWDVVELTVPQELMVFIAPQGSIALAGVSLTIVAVEGTTVTVSLIPHTLASTTLGTLDVGARVNVEVDVVARYVVTALAGRR